MTNSKLWLDLSLKVKRRSLDQIRPKTLCKVSPGSSSLHPRRNCQAHDVLPQGAAEFEVLKVYVVNIYKEILGRGVRSDAQLSSTETQFQKCSQSGKNGSKHSML